MTFAERRRLELDYKEWLKRESIASGVAVKDCALTVIGYLDCKRLINKMPRWIPVSESLPEEYETVIVSVNGQVYPESRYSKEDGWEWAAESCADYWEELEDVQAWMPLPKPYKEGE